MSDRVTSAYKPICLWLRTQSACKLPALNHWDLVWYYDPPFRHFLSIVTFYKVVLRALWVGLGPGPGWREVICHLVPGRRWHFEPERACSPSPDLSRVSHMYRREIAQLVEKYTSTKWPMHNRNRNFFSLFNNLANYVVWEVRKIPNPLMPITAMG